MMCHKVVIMPFQTFKFTHANSPVWFHPPIFSHAFSPTDFTQLFSSAFFYPLFFTLSFFTLNDSLHPLCQRSQFSPTILCALVSPTCRFHLLVDFPRLQISPICRFHLLADFIYVLVLLIDIAFLSFLLGFRRHNLIAGLRPNVNPLHTIKLIPKSNFLCVETHKVSTSIRKGFHIFLHKP